MSYNLQQDSGDYPDLEEVLQRSSDEWLGSEDVNNIFTLHEDPTLSLDPVDEMIAGLFMYSNWSVLDTHVWDTFDDGETIRNKMTREAPNPMRYTVSRMLLAPIAEGVRSTYERRVYTPRHDFAECVLAHYRFVNVDGEDPEDSSGEDVEDSEDSEDPEDSSGEDSEDSEDPGNDSSDDSGDDGGENLVEEGIEDDSEEDAGVGEDDPTDSEPEDAPHSPSCNGHVVLKAMDGNIPGSEYENHTSQILQSLGARVQKTKKTVELTVTPDFQWDDIIHKYVGRLYNNVEDNDGEKQYFLLKKQYTDEDHTLNFTVPIFEPLPPQYFVSVVSDRWIGSQTVLPVSFRHLILPKNCPPPTELLELQPFPETALKNQNYERFYQDCKHFNPVQNQVLTLLNNMNDNVLVVAPTGCGKIIFAEFAILRKYEEGPDAMRLSYIAQLEAIAKKQFLIWERKFVKGLCLRVVEVIGETALDIKLLEKGPIIISTPEKWDTLSRRWKQRKYAQLVSLFILNELHLIGGQGSPALEVIISRMRYISSQANNKIRISALSTFLTSAKDFWEWIGASSHDLFNVPPGVRPVPLEIHIQGLDFEARMQAMTKPTYTTIVQHAKNKKRAIVFVPTFKHIHLTAVDLMVYSHIDNSQSPDFLLGKLEVLEPCVGQIRKETLRHGVGFLCEVLSSLDQEIMTQLFEARRIQVFVMRIIEGETMRYSARNLSSMAMTTRISLSKLPRGNNEVMARGTFANIRIVNKLLKGEVGPKTVHIPTGEKLSVFDAASKCKTAGQDKIILAGAEYGSGSSQDWLQRVPCFWTTEPSRSGSSFRPETWQPPS